jgi:hypothetical protein
VHHQPYLQVATPGAPILHPIMFHHFVLGKHRVLQDAVTHGLTTRAIFSPCGESESGFVQHGICGVAE